MPYIKEQDRKYLDKSIDQLALKLIDKITSNDNLCGELNYSLFRIIKIITNPGVIGGERRYARFNAILGALECCKQEIYRRMVSPYEDEKIKENGDV